MKRRTSIRQIQQGIKNLSCYDQAGDNLKSLMKFYNMRTEVYLIYTKLNEIITQNTLEKVSSMNFSDKFNLKIDKNLVINTSNPIQDHIKPKKHLSILENNSQNMKFVALINQIKNQETKFNDSHFTLPKINSLSIDEWKKNKYNSTNAKIEDSILFKYFSKPDEQIKIKLINEKYLNTHSFVINKKIPDSKYFLLN